MRVYLPPRGRSSRPSSDGGHQAGLAKAQAEHKHRADRHGRTARQTGYRFGRREDAGEEENRRDSDGDLVHPDPVERKQDEHH